MSYYTPLFNRFNFLYRAAQCDIIITNKNRQELKAKQIKKGTIMQILKRINVFLNKLNKVLSTLDKSISLLKNIYKNFLWVIGAFSLHESSPTLFIVSVIIALIYFIYSSIKNNK